MIRRLILLAIGLLMLGILSSGCVGEYGEQNRTELGDYAHGMLFNGMDWRSMYR